MLQCNMSMHWRPDEELATLRESKPRRAKLPRAKLPPGAAAGLALLASACISAGVGLYALAGPRDVFVQDVGGDWSAVEDAVLRAR